MKNNKPFIFAGIFSIFFAVFIIGMTIIAKNREAENPKKVVFEVVFKKISTNSTEEGRDCEDNYNYSNKCPENKDVKNTAKIKVRSSDGSKFRLKNFKPKISYFNLNNEKIKEDNREYTYSTRISFPFTQNDKYFEVKEDYKFIETYIFDSEADKVEIEYSGKKFTFESDDFKKEKDLARQREKERQDALNRHLKQQKENEEREKKEAEIFKPIRQKWLDQLNAEARVFREKFKESYEQNQPFTVRNELLKEFKVIEERCRKEKNYYDIKAQISTNCGEMFRRDLR